VAWKRQRQASSYLIGIIADRLEIETIVVILVDVSIQYLGNKLFQDCYEVVAICFHAQLASNSSFSGMICMPTMLRSCRSSRNGR